MRPKSAEKGRWVYTGSHREWGREGEREVGNTERVLSEQDAGVLIKIGKECISCIMGKCWVSEEIWKF